MPENESFYQASERLDRQMEHDRKMSERYYIALMGLLFLALGAAFFLLHLQIQQSHIA